MTNLPDDKFDWIGTIETFSGKAVDVVNFAPEHVSVEDISRSISLICRYNGHIPHFYSVAEHSVRVAFWIAENGGSPEESLTGLLHDASEAYVGDLIRPLKRLPELGEAHQRIEGRVASVVHQVLGGIYPHPEIVHNADRAIYEWEVENIRTGRIHGWTPDDARGRFIASLTNFTTLLKDQREQLP